MPAMKQFDAAQMSDLSYRTQYLTTFLDFSEADIAVLHAAAPVVKPLVPVIVEKVYDKLLSMDITAKAFIPRNTGFEGDVAATLEELSANHPQILFRKDFLRGYVSKLVTAPYDANTWAYLDKVGVMHTGVAGFKHREKKSPLFVDYMHCGLLLGFVVDIVLDAVVDHPDLDNATKKVVLRALNKVIWIQNDLFARHYIPNEGSS